MFLEEFYSTSCYYWYWDVHLACSLYCTWWIAQTSTNVLTVNMTAEFIHWHFLGIYWKTPSYTELQNRQKYIVSLFHSMASTVEHLFSFDTVTSTGSVTYSEIRAFLKKQPNMINHYKTITTADETVTLTLNHLIYARTCFGYKFILM